jgi:hypothetical protein
MAAFSKFSGNSGKLCTLPPTKALSFARWVPRYLGYTPP